MAMCDGVASHDISRWRCHAGFRHDDISRRRYLTGFSHGDIPWRRYVTVSRRGDVQRRHVPPMFHGGDVKVTAMSAWMAGDSSEQHIMTQCQLSRCKPSVGDMLARSGLIRCQDVCAAVWRSAVVSCGWRRVGRRWRCCGVAAAGVDGGWVACLAAQVSAGWHSNCSRAGSAPVGAREGVPGLPPDVSLGVATAGRPFLRPP